MSLCCVFESVLLVALALSLAVGVAALAMRFLCRRIRRGRDATTIAFFHPYCNAGGGGERVLWCAVRAIQSKYPQHRCVIYSGDMDATPVEILEKASTRFNVTVDPKTVDFVFLRWRRVVEADMYPVFTLLGQFLGGAILGCEALYRFVPSMFIDSMGYPATLPLFRWIADCQTACYVHYPMISTDMLKAVASQESAFNNSARIANSRALSGVKAVYYRLFAAIYGLCGKASQMNLVNSTWTKQHIDELWNRPALTTVLYPPCNTVEFESETNVSEMLFPDDVRIVSIGQFRPEKNHRLQLETLGELKRRQSPSAGDTVSLPTLVLVGSCRHDADQERVDALKQFAQQLGISDNVRWRLNVPYAELKEEVSQALIGIHTMVNEHFGICVVEGMSAGNIMVAHNSGGPQLDIVKSEEAEGVNDVVRVGFLADSPSTYADAIVEILSLSTAERNRIRKQAAVSMRRFNDIHFTEGFLNAIMPLLL